MPPASNASFYVTAGSTGTNANVVCTITNTGLITLQTAKAWIGGAPGTDRANIPATTGGSANTAAFIVAGGTPATGTAVRVNVGDTLIFPAETFTPAGSAANYSTLLACTAAGGATANALSGTNGQASNSLLIGAADTGKAIVCTYTNTNTSSVDLSIIKSQSTTGNGGPFVTTSLDAPVLGRVWFKLVVSNAAGSATANNVNYSDVVPSNYINLAWNTLVVGGGATCPAS